MHAYAYVIYTHVISQMCSILKNVHIHTKSAKSMCNILTDCLTAWKHDWLARLHGTGSTVNLIDGCFGTAFPS